MTLMNSPFSHHAATQMATNSLNIDDAHRQAIFLYQRASNMGWWRRFWRKLRGQSNRLRSLADAISSTVQQHDLGVQSVLLDEIDGSEGRVNDFDVDFLPRQSHTRDRWISVATAWRSGKPLPPIDLIRVGDSYYVRDGHHRLSVARQLGQATIDAQVMLWQ